MQPPSQTEHNTAGLKAGQISNAPSRASFGARLAYVSGVAAVGAVLAAAALHFGFRQPGLETAQARIQQQEVELAALHGRLDDADARAAALSGRLLVEESTRRGLEASLGTVQAELGRARDTLAFYEQLMPPGPDGAISIRALDIERAGPHLKYRMLLMRSGQNGKPFQGELQFIATGRVDGLEVSTPLLPAVAPLIPPDAAAPPVSTGQPAQLALSFSEFQRSSGLLGVPPGFEPESVTVNVLEGRTLRVTRSIDLPVQP